MSSIEIHEPYTIAFPPKVTAYRVVTTPRYEDVATLVNALIVEGWQPFGGVSHITAGHFAQVMVKYETRPIVRS